MSRPRRIPAHRGVRTSAAPLQLDRLGSPQSLRPEIARIIEALAKAAVRREDRLALKTATTQYEEGRK